MGSGWLIDDQTLITAGHVVYDPNYGRTTQLRCYIGYNGRDSVDDPSSGVQVSFGQYIVTTAEWVSKAIRQRDFAIIRLNKPFSGNLRIFGYVTTPLAETIGLHLGVVGYPGDLALKSQAGIHEEGAQMYENFNVVRWDLAKSRTHMIEYAPEDISTAGGQSGAPIILRDVAMKVVGTHCYGANKDDPYNSGNAIGGKFGNDYECYVAVLGGEAVVVQEKNGMKLVRLGSVNKPSVSATTEGLFGDILTGIVAPVVGTVTGPIGGVLSSVAGSILGNLAESAAVSTTESGPTKEKKKDGLFISEGVLERAVVAEAALQTVLQLDPQSRQAQNVILTMKKHWDAGAPNVDTLSKVMAPVMSECGLDMAVGMINKLSSKSSSTESGAAPGTPRPLKGVPATESSRLPFVDLLLGPTVPLHGEEGAFDTLGSWLSTAATAARPIVTSAAKKALASVAQDVAKKLSSAAGTESALDTVTKPTPKTEAASRQVFHRAVMADVALQSLMEMDREALQTLPLKPGSQEGAFDFLKTAVQTLRPFAEQAAKMAVEKVGPIVAQALTSKTEAAKESPNGANGTHKESNQSKPQSLVDLINSVGGSGVSDPAPRSRLSARVVSDANGLDSTDHNRPSALTVAPTPEEKALLDGLDKHERLESKNPDAPIPMPPPPKIPARLL